MKKDNKMKALILAAGMGARLAPITNDKPKSLVEINGKPIIIKQIENLYMNGIKDITIVAGYKANILRNKIQNKYPDVNIIESVDYSTTNNMYSAYLGMRAMFSDENVAPFYLMNADVFFDSSVITALENDIRNNLIVVDIGRYMDESMKVIEKEGILVSISKQISKQDALGCSIDIYKFGEDGALAFLNKCHEYIEEKNEKNKWSEVALNDVLSEIVFQACPLHGRWLEIDTLEDLRSAEELFSRK